VILSVVKITATILECIATITRAGLAFLGRCQIMSGIAFAALAIIVACFAKNSWFVAIAFFGSIGASAEDRFYACTSISIKH
jgi:hypothetical protein